MPERTPLASRRHARVRVPVPSPLLYTTLPDNRDTPLTEVGQRQVATASSMTQSQAVYLVLNNREELKEVPLSEGVRVSQAPGAPVTPPPSPVRPPPSSVRAAPSSVRPPPSSVRPPPSSVRPPPSSGTSGARAVLKPPHDLNGAEKRREVAQEMRDKQRARMLTEKRQRVLSKQARLNTVTRLEAINSGFIERRDGKRIRVTGKLGSKQVRRKRGSPDELPGKRR